MASALLPFRVRKERKIDKERTKRTWASCAHEHCDKLSTIKLGMVLGGAGCHRTYKHAFFQLLESIFLEILGFVFTLLRT